ncbi:MAG: CPBP family intramembrane metalloprotease [Chloroflexi bacterium]|nr:CPBP family intramembrane metalloprotease [Chloroflexota bacterium]
MSYQFLTFGVVVSALAFVLLRYRTGPRALGYRFPGWQTLGLSALAILPVYAAVAVVYAAFHAFAPSYHLAGNAKDVFGVSARHVSLVKLIAVLLFVGVEVPLTEETLFRGILYQGLRNTFSRFAPYNWAIFLAALLSGVIFGLVHGEIHTLPILVLLGVVLAYVFQYARSVYASALLHAVVNVSAAIAYFH